MKIEKHSLRKSLLLSRSEPLPKQNRLIRDSLLRLILKLEKKRIASLCPLKKEIDLRPTSLWLHHAGYEVLLPEITAPRQPLRFRKWLPHLPLSQGRYSTFFPKTAIKTPEIILVPLLGFDESGYRIGYGGGYYDRTLALYHSTIAIGYGLEAQKRDFIPHEPHDHMLDYHVTEKKIYSFKKEMMEENDHENFISR